MKNLAIAFTLLAAAAVFPVQATSAEDFSRIRIVRLSFVEGDVQFQRPGQDWQDARLNLPIEEGFSLRTTNGYAEVEFEDALALRLGTDSTVEFSQLVLQDGGRITHLTIPQGTAMISAKLRRGDAVSVVAGNMTVALPHDARFRMDASAAESWITVFHGRVEVTPTAGSPTQLTSGHTLHETANGSAAPEIAGNRPQDDFDKWVFHREEALGAAQSETKAVMGTSGYTEGFADLYNYGSWSMIPGYGAGWIPYGVGGGWAPFTAGEWMYMGGLGWNWMSGEPWGWLPYHFGSWVNAPGLGWAWLPVGQLTWSPATASWVQVNNQLGWVPNRPPQGPKTSKLAASPSTVILAAQNGNGAIRAGSQISLAKEGATVQAAAAPTFAASAASSAQTSSQIHASFPTSHAGIAGAPASLRAPTSGSSQLRLGQLGATPHTMMAPHSAPFPAIARGASNSGFRAGYGGSARGGSSGGVIGAGSVASVSAPAQTSTAGASHAGSAGTAHH